MSSIQYKSAGKEFAESTGNWVSHGEFGTDSDPRVQAKKYLEAAEARQNTGQPLSNNEARTAMMAKQALGLPLTDEDYAKIDTKETKLREVTNMQNYVNNAAESYGRDSGAMMDEMLKLNGCNSVDELQAKVARGESILEASDTAWNAGIQKEHYAAYDAKIAAQNQAGSGTDIQSYADQLMNNSSMNMSHILNPNMQNQGSGSQLSAWDKPMPNDWYSHDIPGMVGVQDPAYYVNCDLTGNSPLPYSMENMNSPHMMAGSMPIAAGIGASLLGSDKLLDTAWGAATNMLGYSLTADNPTFGGLFNAGVAGGAMGLVASPLTGGAIFGQELGLGARFLGGFTAGASIDAGSQYMNNGYNLDNVNIFQSAWSGITLGVGAAMGGMQADWMRAAGTGVSYSLSSGMANAFRVGPAVAGGYMLDGFNQRLKDLNKKGNRR